MVVKSGGGHDRSCRSTLVVIDQSLNSSPRELTRVIKEVAFRCCRLIERDLEIGKIRHMYTTGTMATELF